MANASNMDYATTLWPQSPRIVVDQAHRAVYTSVKPVLSAKECEQVVLAAEAHAAAHGWTTKRHIAYPTHDLPAEALGAAGELLKKRVLQKLLPELASRFELSTAALGIQDMFVAKYSVLPGGTSPPHTHM